MSYSFTISGLSHVGRVRRRNEDSLSIEPELAIAFVTDGMGGHPGGDVASRIAALHACRTLTELVQEPRRSVHDRDNTARFLADAMERSVAVAHAAVRQRSETEPHLKGMGTTLVGWVGDPSTGAYAMGHVGDSRGYRLRAGNFESLTRDDTWVQDRLDHDLISVEEARRHRYGHMLTQCIGLEEPPKIHVVEGHTAPGDRFLLCTDGLIGMMKDWEIRTTLLEHDDDDEALRVLIDRANEEGGKDNITAVLARVGEE